MARPRPPSDSRRPNTQMVADTLGVSRATVSMALRGDLRISEAVRLRVRQAADRLGYRPDPEMARLMQHLRTRNKPRFKSTLVGLTAMAGKVAQPYALRVIEGARARADELGYKFDLLRFQPGAGRNASLQRMLLSRGIEGLLLLPMGISQSFDELLDWSRFSVVACTRSVLSPEFHRVVPNSFRNTLLICGELERQGFRRIGLVTPKGFDVLISPGLGAGVTWHSELGLTERVPPLWMPEETLDPEALLQWFRREKPDSIIVRGTRDAEVVQRVIPGVAKGRVALAVANLEGSTRYMGIHPHPERIGIQSVDALHLLLQTSQRGPLEAPVETLVLGSWSGVTAAPSRQAATRATKAGARG